MSDILKKDGLTIELLTKLSYQSQLGIRLKKNLHYFEKDELLEELKQINRWYTVNEYLHDIVVDYRIKSIQSAYLKYERYYPNHQTGKVFNDMLGFRALCDNYEDVRALGEFKDIRVADMSKGKAGDDGYRGVHAYFQLDNSYYPIEIQYNTYYDRQMNNWLHKYTYKKNYANTIGRLLRHSYESGKIRTEQEFKEVLTDVLSGSKTI